MKKVDSKLKREIRRVRRTMRSDDAAQAVCNDLEKLIAAGWSERRGPAEPRVAKLHPLWKREPPENP